MKISFFPSLRARIASLILLGVLPMLGLTLYTYLEQRKLVMAHMQDDMRRMVSFIATDQEQVLDGTRQLLFALASIPEIRESDFKSCGALLRRLLLESPRYGNLGVVDVDGKLLCSAAPVRDFGGFSGQPWFERSIETGAFVLGTCLMGSEVSDAALVISYPVKDDGGKVRRIAFAAVDLTQLNQLLSHVQVPRSVRFTMLSRSGAILSCYPDPEGCLGKSLKDTALAKAVVNIGMGTAEITAADGTLLLYAFAPLSSSVDTGLYVAIGLPVTIVYSAATRILLIHFAGLLLVSLLALFVVWLGSTRFILKPVSILVGTAQRLSGGDMAARTGLAYTNGELERLARAFDEMAEALERRAIQLAAYQKQLRSLASQLSLAEERERRRIAIDLHDRVGQALAMANIKLGVLRQLESSAELSGLVDEVSNFIEQAIQEARTLMFEISSPILYELGFEAAIRHRVDQIQKQHGIIAVCEHDQQPKPLDDDVRILLFQAVSELMVNVVKHARARHVAVRIRRDEDQIRVCVEDDGMGFDASGTATRPTLTGGFGLFSIRERLSHIGGGLWIESQPGRGTLVTLVAPIKPRNTASASSDVAKS
jgi:signal transduction histidine kinase